MEDHGGPCRIRVKELTKTANSDRGLCGFAAIVHVRTKITKSGIGRKWKGKKS